MQYPHQSTKWRANTSMTNVHEAIPATTHHNTKMARWYINEEYSRSRQTCIFRSQPWMKRIHDCMPQVATRSKADSSSCLFGFSRNLQAETRRSCRTKINPQHLTCRTKPNISGVEQDIDPMLDPVMEKQFVVKGKKMSVNVSDKAMDFDPRFMMYFITRLPNPSFSPELQAKVRR